MKLFFSIQSTLFPFLNSEVFHIYWSLSKLKRAFLSPPVILFYEKFPVCKKQSRFKNYLAFILCKIVKLFSMLLNLIHNWSFSEKRWRLYQYMSSKMVSLTFAWWKISYWPYQPHKRWKFFMANIASKNFDSFQHYNFTRLPATGGISSALQLLQRWFLEGWKHSFRMNILFGKFSNYSKLRNGFFCK